MAPPGDKRPFFVARPYSSTSPAPLDFDVDELNRDTGAKRRSSVASSTLY
jgi:hypothetical protein